jgi:NADPH:quinone reductase-like Zn-dependent oxidoreductase
MATPQPFPSFASIASAMRLGGVLVRVGFLESPGIALDVRELLRRSLRVEAISVGGRHDLEALAQAFACGAFRPEIDRVFRSGTRAPPSSTSNVAPMSPRWWSRSRATDEPAAG